MVTTAERLEKLGFKGLSEKLRIAKDRKRKLALAYELYRFVRQEHVDRFNKELKEKTKKKTPQFGGVSYSTLSFTPIECYEKAPPESVLANLETAKGHKIFDAFEVAHIVDVKDPIIFGRIKECPDRFFIDQWDNDVCIKDLLRDNEG